MGAGSEFDKWRTVLRCRRPIVGGVAEFLGMDPRKLTYEQQIELHDHLQSRAVPTEIELRTDPLLGHLVSTSTILARERAMRPDRNKLEEIYSPMENCELCVSPGKKTGLFHKGPLPKTDHGKENYSEPNLYPWMDPHYITMLTTEHDLTTRPQLESVTRAMMQLYLDSGRELISKHIRGFKLGDEECVNAWDFINWGPKAGASQPHPHAQRGGLYNRMKCAMRHEADLVALLNKEGGDAFKEHLDLMRRATLPYEGKQQSLVVYEDPNVIVYAPFAPQFTHQVDIVTKKRGRVISNYFDMDEDDRIPASVAFCLETVLKFYGRPVPEKGFKEDADYEKYGFAINNVNVVANQADFGVHNGYHMHWHICPRESLIAGMEMNGMYVVAAYPERTARTLKKVFDIRTSRGEGPNDTQKGS